MKKRLESKIYNLLCTHFTLNKHLTVYRAARPAGPTCFPNLLKASKRKFLCGYLFTFTLSLLSTATIETFSPGGLIKLKIVAAAPMVFGSRTLVIIFYCGQYFISANRCCTLKFSLRAARSPPLQFFYERASPRQVLD